MFKNTKLLSIYSIILISFFIVLPTNNKVKANDNTKAVYCDNTDIMWEGYSESAGGPSSDDIIAQGLSTNLGVNGAIWGWGTFPDSSEKCMAANVKERSELDPDNVDPSCELSPEEQTRCSGVGIMDDVRAFPEDEAYRRGTHGLVGVAYSIEKGLDEPIPMNMAYFIKRNAQKIPIVNKTAFAQSTTNYSGPMLSIVYNYWTMTRNAAMALMSVILLVIGIMIITQKKIDAKAAVTVQQAIPQVVISIILIYLSYPIGATGASLAYALLNSSVNWALDIVQLKETTVPQASAGMGMGFLQALGAAYISVVGTFLTTLVTAFYYIIVLLKIFGIYLKMILGVIVSPLIFAVGAIPGQQKNITKWFKQFAANIVAIPVTMIAFEIVKSLSYELAAVAFTDYDSFAQAYAGSMLGGFVVFLTPMVSFMGMGIVTKVPGEVDKVFGVEKK